MKKSHEREGNKRGRASFSTPHYDSGGAKLPRKSKVNFPSFECKLTSERKYSED